jgi:hypothetical protein
VEKRSLPKRARKAPQDWYVGGKFSWEPSPARGHG